MRFAACLLVLASCAQRPPQAIIDAAAVPAEVRQLVLVDVSGSKAQLTLYERAESWRVTLGPVPAVIGRNGVAARGAKREGDGKTPQGLYALGPAFGYAEQVATALAYRQATPDAVWIDDPKAPDYNTWTTRQETHASSFEHMRRDDGLYEVGVVIAYNTHPVEPGAGSAIFLHVWAGADVAPSRIGQAGLELGPAYVQSQRPRNHRS